LFRKSNPHQQLGFFDSQQLMTPKMKQRLQTSWAQTFREEVMAHIPEEAFAVLFSEVESRPNAPIKVLVGGDILKSGFGWTDEELEEHLNFDLLTRHALGLDELGEEAPTLRTVYNLRRRVRVHAEASGVNLYEVVFASVTDEQIGRLKLTVGWQRMDSTQLLSNIARLNRLELVIAVLQQGVKGLPAERRGVWEAAEGYYLSKPAQNICYRLKETETETHLRRVGQLLVEVGAELSASQSEASVLALVQRTLAEQYEIAGEKVVLKAAAAIGGHCLQSPHDPEATYREKNGGSYKGYVSNLSETCDPDNPVQLITSVQTASNITDDGQLLAASLDEQARRGITVREVTVDGGYNGPTAEEACTAHGVTLRPTTLRGGQGAADRLGWDAYQWQWNEAGQPDTVSCPGGQTASLQPGRHAPWWLARFDQQQCAACPFFMKECRVKPRQRHPPTLSVKLRTIQVARLRQGLSADNYAIRANVESSVHAFKHPFAAGKLPVRGLIRTHMMACGSALMVNMRRLHHYLQAEAATMSQQGTLAADASPGLPLFWFWSCIVAILAHISCRSLTTSLQYKRQIAITVQ
jgi:hypothetical protein